ncbi:unnamed protein product [Arctia plantaginis]|uniref:Uncharacterized protein n=1 Tax=Arctia plantaginis TaxID=874455 RepID=A0A8S1B4S0_ARCPL|nr:unnamed protein product [Arctia plantaginis]
MQASPYAMEIKEDIIYSDLRRQDEFQVWDTCSGSRTGHAPGPKAPKEPKAPHSELEELGEQLPRYRPDSIAALRRATRFTEPELKRLYRGFKAECPTGVVKEETFKLIYSQFFPQGGIEIERDINSFQISTV